MSIFWGQTLPCDEKAIMENATGRYICIGLPSIEGHVVAAGIHVPWQNICDSVGRLDPFTKRAH